MRRKVSNTNTTNTKIRKVRRQNSTCIVVKVIANAKEDAVRGTMADGTLKVSVRAPRNDGKANSAVQRVLAAHYGCRAEDVQIIRGKTSPKKLVHIPVH